MAKLSIMDLSVYYFEEYKRKNAKKIKKKNSLFVLKIVKIV
jgi:hypothetical protein